MANIITPGYSTEGTTDRRFLESIIKRTFDKVAFDCESLITVYDPMYLRKENGLGFPQFIRSLARAGYESGIDIMCLHVDADSANTNNVMAAKINPMMEILEGLGDGNCTNFATILPVHMSESWMLADIPLLKDVLQTTRSNIDLSLHRHPESYADPKSTVLNALRIAQEHLPKRRAKIQIGELYQTIGQHLSLSELSKLDSYIAFKESIERSFRIINFLH
jgi:hypothetical protein